MGRNQFVADKGIDLKHDYFSVKEFVNLCQDHYGGAIIIEMYKSKGEYKR